MGSRFSAGLAALALLTAALPASAADKVYRIGIITYSVGAAGAGASSDGGPLPIKDLLAKQGYREGENVIYQYRAGGRDQSRTDQDALELVAWKPDLIIVQMTAADLSIQKAVAGTDIPVVAWGTDLVQAGLVKSFARSGTNFTGFSLIPEHQMNMLRILKIVKPGIKTVAHLYNPTFAPAPSTLRELKSAAALLNLDLPVYEVLEAKGLEPAFARMKADGVQGVTVGPHGLFNTNGKTIGELSLKYRLPVVACCQTSIAQGGGLAAYAPPNGWPAMAERIDLILKGKARAPDLPIARNIKGALTLNLKSAKALGLTVPPSLIEEADTVIR